MKIQTVLARLDIHQHPSWSIAAAGDQTCRPLPSDVSLNRGALVAAMVLARLVRIAFSYLGYPEPAGRYGIFNPENFLRWVESITLRSTRPGCWCAATRLVTLRHALRTGVITVVELIVSSLWFLTSTDVYKSLIRGNRRAVAGKTRRNHRGDLDV